MAPEVLIVLAPGAEEIEAVTVPDVLVRAGCAVTVAGTAGAGVVAGSRGIPLAAQQPLDQVAGRGWAAVYLPGGAGSAAVCRSDARVQELIRRQLAGGGWLAAICAAPTALIPGGFARGRRLTSFPAVRGELEAAGADWLDAPVVRDGALLTSQAAGTTLALALSLATALCGAAAAEQVAAQIIAPACVRAVPIGA